MEFEEVELLGGAGEVMDWSKKHRDLHTASLLGSPGRALPSFWTEKRMLRKNVRPFLASRVQSEDSVGQRV